MSGLEPLLFGAPAAAIGTDLGAAVVAPATTGLFGSGGAFAAGTALSTITEGFGALGAFSPGVAQRQAAAFQAAVLRQQAERERQIAERDADRFRRRQDRLRATARARHGGSGALPSEGTPLLVDDAAVDEVLLGEATIRAGGRTRATRLEQRAALSRMRGRAAGTRGALRAGNTLLTGFGETFG